jgi:outer membrane protein
MKKSLIALAVAAALVPSLAMAEAGDIVVRLRATHIAPDESSNLKSQSEATFGGATVPNYVYGSGNSANLVVDNNTIPEIDFSYYITKNIAAELILATGTRHDVKIDGVAAGAHATNANLGSVNLLPPTLTLQWHFNPDQTIDPYVGAGLSYVRAMDRSLDTGVDMQPLLNPGSHPADIRNLPIRISRNSWGPAIQAGIDYNVPDSKWLLNVDVKKIWFDTKVEADVSNLGLGLSGWKKIDQLDVDPWVVSVGIGRKF